MATCSVQSRVIFMYFSLMLHQTNGVSLITGQVNVSFVHYHLRESYRSYIIILMMINGYNYYADFYLYHCPTAKLDTLFIMYSSLPMTRDPSCSSHCNTRLSLHTQPFFTSLHHCHTHLHKPSLIPPPVRSSLNTFILHPSGPLYTLKINFLIIQAHTSTPGMMNGNTCFPFY